MAAFLIILGVPFLGVLLYVTEHVRCTGETPRSRSLARYGVLLSGIVLGLAGLITIGETTVWIATGEVERGIVLAIVRFLANVTAGALMLWSSRCAVVVFQRSGSSDVRFREALDERASARVRLASLLLMFVPMLLLGVFGVFFAAPLVLWGVAFRTSRQARQAQFLWTLALAVRHDLPLADEVDQFAKPLWPRTKRGYQALASRLRDGHSLGESLELTSGILPQSMSSEIRIAEETRQLSAVLSDLATTSTSSLSRSRFDGTLGMTLLYGWALLATFLCVVSFIMYWIIPKFVDIFHDFAIELPPITRSAINVSDALMSNFLIVMPLIGLPVLAALVAAVIYFVSWGNLNLPLLMRWFPRQDAPALLRTLSHAVAARQPLPELMSGMANRHLRSDMRQRLSFMCHALEQGQSIEIVLRGEGFIRPAEASALEAAQRAGNLPWAMRMLAEGMERTALHRTQFWLEIVKPTVVVGIGLIVGWFVIAMFMPLVQLITKLA